MDWQVALRLLIWCSIAEIIGCGAYWAARRDMTSIVFKAPLNSNQPTYWAGRQVPAHYLLPMSKPWCLLYHFLPYWNCACYVLLCRVNLFKYMSKFKFGWDPSSSSFIIEVVIRNFHIHITMVHCCLYYKHKFNGKDQMAVHWPTRLGVEEKKEETTAVKYKPSGIAMPCGLIIIVSRYAFKDIRSIVDEIAADFDDDFPRSFTTADSSPTLRNYAAAIGWSVPLSWKTENRPYISRTVWPIFTKFGMLMHIGSRNGTGS